MLSIELHEVCRWGLGERELTDAILVNPYDTDGFADAIQSALHLPDQDKRIRMARMRESVAENNTYNWAAKLIMEIRRLL